MYINVYIYICVCLHSLAYFKKLMLLMNTLDFYDLKYRLLRKRKLFILLDVSPALNAVGIIGTLEKGVLRAALSDLKTLVFLSVEKEN